MYRLCILNRNCQNVKFKLARCHSNRLLTINDLLLYNAICFLDRGLARQAPIQVIVKIYLERVRHMRIRKEIDTSSEDINLVATVADALSHPARVAILQYVAQKNEVRNDVCNGDLVKFLDYSQATISQHVKKLVNAELLQTEKQDKYTIYYVNREKLDNYITRLKEI
jgi:ArsR family transcriptional regulator